MERKYSESTLASVGRALLLVAALTSTTSFAIDEICSPTVDSNPVPEVEGQINRLDCAAKDAFQNSCAYKEWTGKFLNIPAKNAKEYVERVSPLLDPKCAAAGDPCALKGDRFELAKTLNEPAFIDYFENTTFTQRSLADVQREVRDTRKVERFERAKKALSAKGSDEMGVIKSTLFLLQGQLPTDFAAKKKLMEKIALDAFKYKEDHLEGCENARARVVNRVQNAKFVGPKQVATYTGIEAQGNTIVDKGIPHADPNMLTDMVKAADKASSKYRTFDGIVDSLQSCGESYSRTMGKVGEVIEECEVNFPQTIFPDNSKDLAPTASAALSKALETDVCYQNAVKAGLPLLQVSVGTSANTLHNTANYCKWDFAKLSADRATSLRTEMQSVLKSKLNGIPIGMSFRGDRGDGSSGPCAYQANEVKSRAAAPKGSEVFEVTGEDGVNRFFTETRHPDFDSPEEVKKLEDKKYARVTVFFGVKATGPRVNLRGEFRERVGTPCRQVEFTCN